VHHGLQAAADGFVQHCEAFCATHEVPLFVSHVDARHVAGESPEDAARRARYLALSQLAAQAGAQHVLLAQHADDQVETLLLALSRGAGLPGLAAMPASFERHGVSFHRPVLSVRASDIRAWLGGQGVAFVEDPTNADTAFTRNHIRAQLLPALEAVFPQFRDTFARSARHAAQAQRLLAALAEEDLVTTGDPPGLKALQRLPRERQANLLRHWLRTRHAAAASAAQLEELLDQVAVCTTRGHNIRIKVGAGSVRREADVLAWYNCTV
jgi:tRNA(Ile)-lysidine synthase